MKSYEVKQMSTILSHLYNLEKLKNSFIASKTICFLIIAVEPLRSCVFLNARFSPLPWLRE